MHDGGEIIGHFAVGHSWDDIDNPFVIKDIREDPQEKRSRERAYARMERNKRRARRRALFFAQLAIILLAVVSALAGPLDKPEHDTAIPTPEATEKPLSEETTMHVITPDWAELMVQAVLSGSERAGMDCVELGGLSYTYDDLYLLAKIIQEEDGSDDAGHEWPDMPIIAIANVVLNRVASPLYPDTIREVLYQVGDKGEIQYAPVHERGWEEIEPTERYVRLAQRALEGERAIGEDVIYQALFVQGPIVMTYHDDYLGSITYFCKE